MRGDIGIDSAQDEEDELGICWDSSWEFRCLGGCGKTPQTHRESKRPVPEFPQLLYADLC